MRKPQRTRPLLPYKPSLFRRRCWTCRLLSIECCLHRNHPARRRSIDSALCDRNDDPEPLRDHHLLHSAAVVHSVGSRQRALNAACSSAYSTCQTDAASCTAALANGVQGITVTAPNGGATITAIPSVGIQSASSICQSLSSLACYQLDVRACEAFGGGLPGSGWKNCGNMYRAGAAGLAAGLLLR